MHECIEELVPLWFPSAFVGLDYTVDYHRFIECSMKHTSLLTILLSLSVYCGEEKIR